MHFLYFFDKILISFLISFFFYSCSTKEKKNRELEFEELSITTISFLDYQQIGGGGGLGGLIKPPTVPDIITEFIIDNVDIDIDPLKPTPDGQENLNCNDRAEVIQKLRVFDLNFLLYPALHPTAQYPFIKTGLYCGSGTFPCPLNQVTHLGLSNLFSVYKKIPSEITCLSNLNYLSFSSNSLTGSPDFFTPKVVEFLSDQLLGLDLSDNEIQVIPLSIFELKELKTLNFSKNKIRNLPNSIESLNKLKKIDLSDNYLTNISNLKGSFEKVSINDNQVRLELDIIDPSFRVDTLEINSSLSSFPPSFASMKVNYLFLANPIVTNISTLYSSNHRFNNIESGIDFSNSAFEEIVVRLDIFPTNLLKAPNLEKLILSSGNIASIPTISDCSQSIYEIDLSFNQISASINSSFFQCAKKFNLSGNPLNSVAVHQILNTTIVGSTANLSLVLRGIEDFKALDFNTSYTGSWSYLDMQYIPWDSNFFDIDQWEKLALSSKLEKITLSENFFTDDQKNSLKNLFQNRLEFRPVKN